MLLDLTCAIIYDVLMWPQLWEKVHSPFPFAIKDVIWLFKTYKDTFPDLSIKSCFVCFEKCVAVFWWQGHSLVDFFPMFDHSIGLILWPEGCFMFLWPVIKWPITLPNVGVFDPLAFILQTLESVGHIWPSTAFCFEFTWFTIDSFAWIFWPWLLVIKQLCHSWAWPLYHSDCANLWGAIN